MHSLHRHVAFITGITGIILLLISSGIDARPLPGPAARFYLAANAVSLDQAVQQVKQQTGGRILSAETVQRNGQKVHRIKVLLADGTVRVMYINAN